MQKGHTNVRNGILPFEKAAQQPFLKMAAIFSVLEPGAFDVSSSLTIHLLFTAPHGECNDSKHWKQKTHGPSFDCLWLLLLPVTKPDQGGPKHAFQV